VEAAGIEGAARCGPTWQPGMTLRGTGWLYGTLFINITGCSRIALFMTAA